MRASGEARKVQRRRAEAENRDRQDERDGADFQQRQHEQNRSPARRFETFRQDHDGPAEAHRLPGDEQRRAVLETADSERPGKAHGRAEHPAAAAVFGGSAQGAGERRRRQAESEQPQSLRLHAKGDCFACEMDGKHNRRGRVGKPDYGGGNSADSAGREERAAKRRPPSEQGDERGGDPQEKA